MNVEEQELMKKRWGECSPKARIIAEHLKNAGYLKVPDYQKGWGLGQWLKVEVAETIDETLEEKI